MSIARCVARVLPGKRVTDGGGVPVRRTVGDPRLPLLDPFLLVDEFKSTAASDVDAGLPSHPHRGLETVTYVISGEMRVRDSSGSEAHLGPGCVQWTTAASGVIHEEMPVPGTPLRAVQFWLNLPRSEKMDPPRVQVLSPDQVVSTTLPSGGEIRLIAGATHGIVGSIGGGSTRPGFADITLPPGGAVSVDIGAEKVAMLYVLEGQGMFGISGTSTGEMVGRGHLIVLSEGDAVKVLAGHAGTRFLVLSAVPIGEPVCRYGPIVMTTPDEIDIAVADYHSGAFVRHATQLE